MKIKRITTNADIYTNRPHLKQKIASNKPPAKTLDALHIYKFDKDYCVLFEDSDGLFINKINTLRLILLVSKLCGMSACICERAIKVRCFPEFNINDFA